MPYGVVTRIAAFNHPAYYAVAQTVRALLIGNAVVLKPSHRTPLASIAVGEFMNQHLAPGLFNVITGGGQVGDALVRHPRVKRIAFTGSLGTGLRIMRDSAEVGVKHVSLEFGGRTHRSCFPTSIRRKRPRWRHEE